jgi:hypothetical protein
LKVVCHDDRLFHAARAALHGLSPFARHGHRRAPNALRRLLQFSILVARAITHRTPQKAELFCEIRMRRQAAAIIAWKYDGRLLLLAFPGIAEATGRRMAQKTNSSAAFFLTESLHQFA